MVDHGMLAPVLALVGWTFVMWFWMYATRQQGGHRGTV